VDISTEMLAKLAEKSAAVTTVEADMTTVRLEREFAVAFIAFNSIFVLGTQREQVDLFRNAARHLRPGGRFVLETVVIQHNAGEENRGSLAVVDVGPDSLTLSAGVVDPVTALYTGTWVVLTPNGTTFYPQDGRHVTHHEMDLMAELAGLSLEHRWSDWKGGTFGKDSRLHVSIYCKPA
jgi:SAM-dependent methyltransferase